MKSLNHVFGLREKSMQDALLEFQNANKQFQQGQQRKNQLVNYRFDYLQQMADLGQKGGTLGQLRSRADFISSLDNVIKQINTQLILLEKQNEFYKQLYYKAKIDMDAVGKLIQREEEIEKDKIRCKELKDSDEYAQKQWYTRESHSKKNMNFE